MFSFCPLPSLPSLLFFSAHNGIPQGVRPVLYSTSFALLSRCACFLQKHIHTCMCVHLSSCLLMSPRVSTNVSFEPKEFSLEEPKHLSGIRSQGNWSVCSMMPQPQAEVCPQWFEGLVHRGFRREIQVIRSGSWCPGQSLDNFTGQCPHFFL